MLHEIAPHARLQSSEETFCIRRFDVVIVWHKMFNTFLFKPQLLASIEKFDSSIGLYHFWFSLQNGTFESSFYIEGVFAFQQNNNCKFRQNIDIRKKEIISNVVCTYILHVA